MSNKNALLAALGAGTNPDVEYMGFVHWQQGEAITVRELLQRMAIALHPEDETEVQQIGRAGCEINLEAAALAAVRSGRLTVRNPLDMRPHTAPRGAALWSALVVPGDANAFVQESALAIVVRTENAGHVSETTEWEREERAKAKRHSAGRYTMAEAAQVMADAYPCSAKDDVYYGINAKDFLYKKMVPAFDAGALVVISPGDTGPVRGRQCRVQEDWVTPENMNAWLERDGFSYRWPIASSGRSDAPSVEHLSLREAAQVLGCSEERVLQHAVLDGFTAHVLYVSEVLDASGEHSGAIRCLAPLTAVEVASLRALGVVELSGFVLLSRKPAIGMPHGKLDDDVLQRVRTGPGSFTYRRSLKNKTIRVASEDLLFELEDVKGLLAARGRLAVRPVPGADDLARTNRVAGLWRLPAAMAEIERNAPVSADSLLRHAMTAVAKGLLHPRDLAAGGMASRGDHLSDWLDWFLAADINAWLESSGVQFTYRLPAAQPLGRSDTLSEAAEAFNAFDPLQPRYADEASNNEYTLGWWNAELNASMWWALNSVNPVEAAMLLCGLNPADPAANGNALATPHEPDADDYNALLRWFEDAVRDGSTRTLRQWLGFANDRGLKHHSWIDAWIAALPPEGPGLQDSTTALVEIRPLSRAAAQDAMLLGKLRELGFDPKALPPVPPGKLSAAKAAARKALLGSGWSKEVFKKSWQRLRGAGEIANH